MINEFIKLYPEVTDIRTAFCPYRVCPVGAHIDHQFGMVTGFAIDKGIEIVFSPTDNGIVELQSMNFSGMLQFHVSRVPEKKYDWADYLRGATMALGSRYELHYGIYALICGSLPIGGLSSSAAVILAYLNALCTANNIKPTQSQLIEIALSAEKDYVGVSVGKLDQSCEVYSRKDHLLFLDTLDDNIELIPKSIKMKDFEVAIVFSGLERSLGSSAFNMRVDELKAASYALKAYAGMDYNKFNESYMRDVPEEIFKKYKDKLPENWRKRAEHYYGEMSRVKRGVEAWRAGDIEEFGRISTESGLSSINNYETGSDELKAICEILYETDGVYGGRFSGAGFKGFCMALIDPAFKDIIKRDVTAKYLKIFPQYEGKFAVHFCKSADGCVIQ